jgi:hypothetical protein
MKTLELRALQNTYEKINKNYKKEIYHNAINNNLIIFDPCDKSTNTDSICIGISNKAYLHLINELNSNNNLVVYWSQIEGTTSDYTIYYDLNSMELIDKNYKETMQILSNQPNIPAYKYVKVQNGKAFKLDKETIENDIIKDWDI